MPYNPAQCTHIKSNGDICHSPALKGRDKCYWHAHVIEHVARNAALTGFPILDDGGAVQIVIMKVLRALAERRIDYKAAQLMIWAAQVAMRNMRSVNDYIVKEPGVDMRERLAAVLEHNERAQKAPKRWFLSKKQMLMPKTLPNEVALRTAIPRIHDVPGNASRHPRISSPDNRNPIHAIEGDVSCRIHSFMWS